MNPGGQRHRLLIVEDEQELANSMVQALEPEYEVAVASDPPAAFTNLDLFHPDVVLLDIILPRGTGLQVLERVAAAQNGPKVLVMSGYAADLDLSRFASVVAGIMSKPFKLDEMRQRVQEALTRRPVADADPKSPARSSILLVDDDPDVADQLKIYLQRRGYQITVTGTGPAALSAVARRRFDLVVTDWILPGMSGMELLQELRKTAPGVPVILLSGYATLEFARRALGLGAADVLPKPLPPKALYLAVEKCLVRAAQTSLPRSGQAGGPSRGVPSGRATARGDTRYGLQDILGIAPAVERLRQSLIRVARFHSTVLINGETGSGKELVAQALHRLSARSERGFVAVNASAIPESLLESELFGYGAGAFTGAKREGHPGKFVQADGGTLFLDEIGDLPFPLQSKLLRVLEEGEVDPVGGSGPRRVDVRVIAATHRDLEQMVGENRFRADLYYRLKVVHLHLPPLRERPEDIPILAAHILDNLAQQYGVPAKGMTPLALELMRQYPWPGNVRELRNVVEQAFAFAPGELIEPAHLPDYLCRAAITPVPPGPPSPGPFPPAADRSALEEALAASGGNKVKAARLLGISRATLYVRLKLNGLV